MKELQKGLRVKISKDRDGFVFFGDYYPVLSFFVGQVHNNFIAWRTDWGLYGNNTVEGVSQDFVAELMGWKKPEAQDRPQGGTVALEPVVGPQENDS